MTAFWPSLARMAGLSVLAGSVGWLILRPLFPEERAWWFERFGWGIVAGLFLTAATVPLAAALGWAPGWPLWLAVAILSMAISRIARRPRAADPCGRAPVRWGPLALFAAVGLAAGLLLYGLRALTEPMWSNDFLAIWGLKGKTIFASRSIPARLFRDPTLGYSHPEYPLGLPFLYAGVASLAGEWDDHAMALLFPAFQVATAAVLVGWLRRRGAGAALALGAAAVVALFGPLYSAFATGLADVPLSSVLLLLGTAWSDALDDADRAAQYRLGFASLLAAGTKNEGLFLAISAALLTLALPGRSGRRARIAIACILPAVLVTAAQRLATGPALLRDFDFGLLTASRIGQVIGRAAEGLGTAVKEVLLPSWLGLVCVAALVALGRRFAPGDRLLLLAATGLGAYLLLPTLAIRGPSWLVRTSFPRTAAALAPVGAAGIAARLGRLAPVSRKS